MDERDALIAELKTLDLGIDVLHQHVDIVDRRIEALDARLARIERKLDQFIEPASVSLAARRTN
jgi:hypothetical protein